MYFLKKILLLPFLYKKQVQNFDFSSVKSILIRPTGNALGDSIINSVYVTQLKMIYPNVRIGMLVTHSNKAVYALNPYLDEMIEQNFSSFLSQRGRWQVLLDMPDAFNSSKIILDKILAPEFTIIFDKKYKPLLNIQEVRNYDVQVKNLDNVHNIDFIKHSIFADYFSIPDGRCELKFPNEIPTVLQNIWTKGKFRILLAPQGSRRLVPVEEIAELLNGIGGGLIDKVEVILNYIGKEDDYLKKLQSLIHSRLEIKSMPKMQLEDYLYFVSSSDLVVGVDSGTVHVACALNKPLLSFYANFQPNIIRWSPKPNDNVANMMLVSLTEGKSSSDTFNFDLQNAISWLNQQITKN